MRTNALPWFGTLGLVLAWNAAAFGQAPGNTRLFVNCSPSVPTKSKVVDGRAKLSPELQALVASGGNLVGQTTKGLVIIDVDSDSANMARKKIAGLPQKPRVYDNAANAGAMKKVTRMTVRYAGKEPPTAALEQLGLKILRHSKPGSFLLVDAPKGITAETIGKMQGVQTVDFIQTDRILTLPRPVPRTNGKLISGKGNPGKGKLGIAAANLTEPMDPFYKAGILWGLRHVDCPRAWKRVRHAPEIIVAVIDTGVDYQHVDLKGNIWINQKELNGKPGVDDDENGYVDDIHGYDFAADDPDPMDDHDHGTHCAGTIGASMDNNGVVGVVWKVKIMPLRFLDASGSGNNADAIFCIDYAIENGARIINASWGGYGNDPLLAEALDRAEKAGVLVVAAAGNDANDNDGDFPHFPSSYPHQNILSVMAIDREDGDKEKRKNGKKASFSNFGKKSVHLAAPGVGILSTTRGGGYQEFDGTSMAAPHVAGAAALILGHPDHKNLDCKALRQLILDNGLEVPSLQALCSTGRTLNLEFLDLPSGKKGKKGKGAGN